MPLFILDRCWMGLQHELLSHPHPPPTPASSPGCRGGVGVAPKAQPPPHTQQLGERLGHSLEFCPWHMLWFSTLWTKYVLLFGSATHSCVTLEKSVHLLNVSLSICKMRIVPL